MARLDRRNVTRYWWDGRVPGLSLMRADFTTHDYAPHTHDAFVVAVTEQGGARILSRNVEDAVCPARLFVSNPEEPQAAWMGHSRRWRYRSLYLMQPAIDVIARGLGIAAVPYFTRNVLVDAELVDAIGHLHRILEVGGDGFRADELLIDALGRLFRRHGSRSGGGVARAPRDTVLVGKAIALMRDRYADDLKLDALARDVGLTSFQLIGMFKRTVGMTPHAYLIDVRLGQACRALTRGHALAEAALAAGFCDQSALTKHFKRRYGITPRQLADAARARRPAIFANTPAPEIG
jgi:AraC-like DNA-binding protein